MPQLEVLTHKPAAHPRPTPLLFVHGAWHAAWCWDEFFLPYFAEKGYAVHALSLRGHGGSSTDRPVRWLRARDYVADIEQIVKELAQPPVLIAHSMGGYVAQKYLETHTLPAAALLASIPAGGILPYVLRQVWGHPFPFLKTSLTFRPYHLVGTPQLSKAAFFSDNMPDEQARRYHARLQDESYVLVWETILLNLPRPKRVQTPLLVLGAVNDRVFPPAEVEATARAYNTQARLFPDMAHDMMLEAGWQAVADTILEWLDKRGL
jgi:pimeloyl-ACP methyl ester carboxylesterase